MIACDNHKTHSHIKVTNKIWNENNDNNWWIMVHHPSTRVTHTNNFIQISSTKKLFQN